MKFGIVGTPHKENLPQVIGQLLRKLEASGAEYLISSVIAASIENEKGYSNKSIFDEKDLFKNIEILIALGGDGTILRYAREIAAENLPILGVNLGKLGFLAEVSVAELSDCIDEILKSEYNISERMMIEAEVVGMNDGVVLGLNDIVIDRGGTFRIIDVETYVDEDYLITFKGDGLIVSSPTGSTGYSLSCGGPIVVPDANVIILTPISPHTLNARPVIIPDSKPIRVIVHSQEQNVPLTADGQRSNTYKAPVEIVFKKSKYTTKLIKRKSVSYYNVLRSKLMWGRDVRVKI